MGFGYPFSRNLGNGPEFVPYLCLGDVADAK
jgi:hypothetical protein